MINIKIHNRCTDVNTLPAGFHTDQKNGKSVPNMNLDSAIQARIPEFSTTGDVNFTHMVPLNYSLNSNQSLVHSILNDNHSTTGQSFGRSRTIAFPKPGDYSVVSVSINERSYYSLEFYSNINHLKWLINQLVFTYFVLGCFILNFVCILLPIIKRENLVTAYELCSMTSIVANNSTSFSMDKFRYLKLIDPEWNNVCVIGLDM